MRVYQSNTTALRHYSSDRARPAGRNRGDQEFRRRWTLSWAVISIPAATPFLSACRRHSRARERGLNEYLGVEAPRFGLWPGRGAFWGRNGKTLLHLARSVAPIVRSRE